MPLIEWGPALSVGITQFDQQHQQLVGMLNDLHDAIATGRGKEQLTTVLDGLIVYTLTHFEDEEREMARYDFPGLATHKAIHDALVLQVAEVQRKFDAGTDATLPEEVTTFLKGWLVDHILGTDRGYTSFLRGKGLT